MREATKDNPSPFMAGLTKLLPMTMEGKVDNTITVTIRDETAPSEDGRAHLQNKPNENCE
jgi:hypothetical protein